VLSQGNSGSLNEMVAEFRRRGNAVLVGAASFWEGIDVVGDALQILLITRLPFDVPTDPWIAARTESLQAVGRDSFLEYSVPVAAMRLKQGIGRLIRHPEDRGVAIVADPRLVRSRYGRVIQGDVPVPVRPVDSEVNLCGEINRFFEQSDHD
jgi:ATP-dependent DNA helicase DinG